MPVAQCTERASFTSSSHACGAVYRESLIHLLLTCLWHSIQRDSFTSSSHACASRHCQVTLYNGLYRLHHTTHQYRTLRTNPDISEDIDSLYFINWMDSAYLSWSPGDNNDERWIAHPTHLPRDIVGAGLGSEYFLEDCLDWDSRKWTQHWQPPWCAWTAILRCYSEQ